MPKYQQIAAEVVCELENGANKKELATRLGVSMPIIGAAWRYGRHGVVGTLYKPEFKPYNPQIPAFDMT